MHLPKTAASGALHLTEGRFNIIAPAAALSISDMNPNALVQVTCGVINVTEVPVPEESLSGLLV